MDWSYLNKKRLERWGRRYSKGVKEIVREIMIKKFNFLVD